MANRQNRKSGKNRREQAPKGRDRQPKNKNKGK
jgi:hypothetical protein